MEHQPAFSVQPRTGEVTKSQAHLFNPVPPSTSPEIVNSYSDWCCLPPTYVKPVGTVRASGWDYPLFTEKRLQARLHRRRELYLFIRTRDSPFTDSLLSLFPWPLPHRTTLPLLFRTASQFLGLMICGPGLWIAIHGTAVPPRLGLNPIWTLARSFQHQ